MDYTTLKSFVDRYGASFLLGAVNDRVTGVSAEDMKDYADGNEPSPSQKILDVEAIFEDVRADAQSEVDSYLGTVQDLPITKVPRMLEGVTNALIAYALVKSPSIWLGQERKDAIDWLRDVSRGIVTLGTDTSENEDIASNQVAQFTGRSDAKSNVMSDSQRQRFEGDGQGYRY